MCLYFLLSFSLLLLMNLLGWHWLTKIYRFQVDSSTNCTVCSPAQVKSPSTIIHPPLKMHIFSTSICLDAAPNNINYSGNHITLLKHFHHNTLSDGVFRPHSLPLWSMHVPFGISEHVCAHRPLCTVAFSRKLSDFSILFLPMDLPHFFLSCMHKLDHHNSYGLI